MPPKTKKKGGEPSPNLPSLFPTHDGSYGINTLINTDADPKKGQKSNAGIAKEQSDDNKWAKAMKAKLSMKYNMNSNLKKAIDESHKQVEKEDSNSPSRSGPPSSSRSVPGKPPELLDDTGFIPELTPHIPNYNPNSLPFSEEYDDRPQPPYKRAELPSADPYAHFGGDQPISPPSEDVPFYGMPQGEGSKEPISPTRPDSSRSFYYESGLFANATLQTPGQATSHFGTSPAVSQGLGSFGAPPAVPQGLGLPGKNQTAGQFKFTGRFNAGLPTPGQSNSSTSGQPPLGGQLVSNSQSESSQSSSGEQPPSSFQPHPQGQPTPGQPPNVPKAPTIKTSTKRQGQPSNNPQTGNTSATRLKSARIGRAAKRQQGRIWPLASRIIPPMIWFSTLVLAIWLALSLIPVEFNESEAGVTPSSIGRPYFSFGTIWKTISGLLPEIPEIGGTPHGNPYSSHDNPGSSDSGEINPKELIEDLKKWMPESIWVQGEKNGKIKIPEDFWHALKELIKQDDSILSLKNSDISEDHWRAIKARVQTAGFDAGESTNSIEGLVERKMSQSWDTWLGQNDQALKKAVTGLALTKDEFMELYQQEIVSYQREIRQELTELQKRISSITQQMSRLPDEITSNASIAKVEITRILDSLVAQAISNAQLDAIAQGFIKGHANDVLANQVNFFGIGAGAAIDPDFTSRAWDIPKDHFMSKKYMDRDGSKVQPPTAALSPWSQEGECFCAGPDRKGYGKGTNNITVLASRDIIPQHLVVEHILPVATLDPGAMPKEIEVWVYIEEVTLRNHVQAFSERQFPGSPKEVVLSDGFVKVGHFTYENKSSGDGVQVFKISDELARMSAITNHIVIRAINNYGADHTCFYRLRVYGKIIERPDHPPVDANKWTFWG